MRKFLSLVLALAMAMSLVVVNTSAKEFTDDDELNYEEAVAVISEIGVVDGYADGSFKPQNGLTRGAAAKIICNLILGPTTAAELHADTRPFKDVAIDSEFAGYIAYCAQQGIISGYADGEFKAGNPLTGYAFMKMLLGALGYDTEIEKFVGENWSINVAKQALGIGLNAGLVDEFNGVDYVTREEAALYAFNTLKATMVDYENKISANVNGAEVVISNNTAKPVTWSEGRNNDGNIKEDTFVQFAEEYFPDLVRRDDSTKFEEPANTWIYEKTEIGTFERRDLIVETYTTGVTGRDLYDLLKPGVIDDNDLEVYVDGVEAKGDGTFAGSFTTIARFDKDDMVRANTKDVGATGNGVLTKVYLDTDKDLITIVSINTWLSKATADYSDSKEYAPLSVFTGWKDAKRTYNVDVEEVANVVDVTADTYYAVNISWKDNDNGEVVTIGGVEILEDSTVTKFTATDEGKDTSGTNRYVTKLTTGGEEYSRNEMAYYDDEVLDTYNQTLLTDNTYNVYLDQYGYFLGVDLFEGTKNYVFITGFDRNTSNLSVKTATATGIFLDGSMENIQVNVTDTDKNIDKALAVTGAARHNADYFTRWSNGNWTALGKDGDEGVYDVNQWYTYTVSESGVYTLKPAVRMTMTQFLPDAAHPVVGYGTDNLGDTIRTDNLSIQDNGIKGTGITVSGNGTRVYGEDATVFLTVDLDIVDTTDGDKKAITDVTGVYTGVQNVDIDIDVTDPQAIDQHQVFTVYDSDYYVIGAVVIGEARGSTANYAYIVSGAKSEELRDGTYYWTFDAIMGGEEQTLTARSKYESTIDDLKKGTVQELRFDGDYVVSIKDIEKLYTDYTQVIDGQDVYAMRDELTPTNPNDNPNTLVLQGRTLYVTNDQSDVGLGLAAGAKAVTIQTENGKADVVTNFSDVASAIAHLADADPNNDGFQYDGKIYAVLNSNATADWVVFVNDKALTTGSNTGFQGGGTDTTLPASTDLWVDVATGHGISGDGRYDASAHKLYLKFDGLTAGASKVTLPVKIVDAFGAGTYATLTLDLIKGTDESKVYVTDFTAVDTSNALGIPMLNRIDVSLMDDDTVTEWYVDYEDNSDAGVKFAANSQETVAVDGYINFTLELPAGVKTAAYKWGTTAAPAGIDQSTLTPAFAAITKAETYTVKANGGATIQPKVSIELDQSTTPAIKDEGVAGAESRPLYSAAYGLAGVQVTTVGNTTTIGGYTASSLDALCAEPTLAAIMEGSTNQGYLWVGVNFTSPKDVNGNSAVSCQSRVYASGTTAPSYSAADYHDNTAYQWFGVAKLTGNGTYVIDTVYGAQTWTVDLEWTFADGGKVVETYTVVRAGV